MSRTQEQVQNEYGQAAAQLGQEEYLKSLAQEQIEKHEYNAGKLKNKMQSLAKEAAAIKEAQQKEANPKQSEEKKEEASVEQA